MKNNLFCLLSISLIVALTGCSSVRTPYLVGKQLTQDQADQLEGIWQADPDDEYYPDRF